MSAVCSECGEGVQQVQPNDWVPAWGPPVPSSHTDGSALCPVPGTDHFGESSYVPCAPEFV